MPELANMSLEELAELVGDLAAIRAAGQSLEDMGFTPRFELTPGGSTVIRLEPVMPDVFAPRAPIWLQADGTMGHKPPSVSDRPANEPPDVSEAVQDVHHGAQVPVVDGTLSQSAEPAPPPAGETDAAGEGANPAGSPEISPEESATSLPLAAFIPPKALAEDAMGRPGIDAQRLLTEVVRARAAGAVAGKAA